MFIDLPQLKPAYSVKARNKMEGNETILIGKEELFCPIGMKQSLIV